VSIALYRKPITQLVVVVTNSPSGSAYRPMETGEADVPKILLSDCHCPGTHLWCQWSHQSTISVLLPTLDRREVNVVQRSPPMQFHSEDRLET